MNKKQFLEFLWEKLIIYADIDLLPKKETDVWKIDFTLHVGYGETAEMLKKHIEDYQRKEAEKWLIEMGKEFDEGSLKTETQKELTLPDQERH